MKVAATILSMGNEVEVEPLDITEGRVYVLLEMPVEHARKLAPVLGKPIGIEVVLHGLKANPAG